MERVGVSVVSYLNSKPFAYGLLQPRNEAIMDVTFDNPARCAEKLITDEADIGLVPVAVIPHIKDARIISDYCIAADGRVDSVLLLSERPVHEITHVILDGESRTSVMLARILMRELWKINPEMITEREAGRLNPEGTTAVIIIGDRALKVRNDFAYCYDLATGWMELTGLPFVFACWVANKPVEDRLRSAFNVALAEGVEATEKVIAELRLDNVSGNYLRNTIRYKLDTLKRKSIDLFLEKVKSY